MFLGLVLFTSLIALQPNLASAAPQDQNALDELNPFDPNIEQTLQELDQDYEQETGLPSHLNSDFLRPFDATSGCYRLTCTVYAQISKSEQYVYIYINGKQTYAWPVSTGADGYETPNLDTHPNGRIYDSYTSTKYPGGDYNGLGNMPYAVFIKGGFAIHGTGQGNWRRLGSPASHGCIRLHPDNAKLFNRLVRQYGIFDVWITVQ
ncbi:MAG: L,D-transpeptidase [Bdellovibrio sp. CG10_big_fil_rev_8_21_14_0_10_47_8]|nr:MAG: L,D-transpeptidase [Bdellovibrio sp. CG10_big_fil_rev_8_21_14_0_10_47_8]